ncbi:MAG TPA: hypothetical protein VNJ54_05530 [Plantibacter sp.]|uniref:hypothetical protein n=1 Tax=unclassified Plantibacter TaxID=2624265 RepID=UPI002BA770B0|nr:hypothetical protein [Plantibacter sp.]
MTDAPAGRPSSDRRADRVVFRASRAVLAGRDGRPRVADIAFIVYASILVALIVGAPLVRFAVLGLIEPDAASVVASITPGVASLLAAGAVLLVLLGGRVRGPVVPRPAAVAFLADSPLPRRLTLRRPFVTSAIALVVGGLLAGGVVALSRLLVPADSVVSAGSRLETAFVVGGAGPTEPGAVVAFLVGGLGFCVLLSVVWLLGQRGSGRVAAAIASAVATTGLIGLWLPALHTLTPWGWTGLLWARLRGDSGIVMLSGPQYEMLRDGASSSFLISVQPPAPLVWPAVALVIVGVAALMFVPRSLDALRSAPLLEQAQRWQRVGVMVQSGDTAGAVGGLRSTPRSGRRVPLRMTGPLWLVVLRRSLVGALRTPGRVLFGSAVLLACGIGVGFTLALPDGVRWMLAVPVAFVAYLAVGVWCDAVRHGVESAGTPTLYGRSTFTLVVAGAIAPLVVAVLLGGLGALLGALASPAAGGIALLEPLWWWLLLALWIVVLRVFDAAKGPLPITLLMPVPTPFGDASSANVLLWQSDAVLLALLVGGGLTALLPVATGAAVVLLLVMLLIVAAIGSARLRKLSRPA